MGRNLTDKYIYIFYWKLFIPFCDLFVSIYKIKYSLRFFLSVCLYGDVLKQILGMQLSILILMCFHWAFLSSLFIHLASGFYLFTQKNKRDPITTKGGGGLCAPPLQVSNWKREMALFMESVELRKDMNRCSLLAVQHLEMKTKWISLSRAVSFH